ncbi:MAG: sigma-54 dependent transcriptional regulator [Alphaproteobacteria bacterium]|nr:sigma-54 dependent transcriptional regulator [Alphaproteobacteria bacterium]
MQYLLVICAEHEFAAMSETLDHQLPFRLMHARSAAAAHRLLNDMDISEIAALLLDARSSSSKAPEVIRGLRSLYPALPLVAFTGYAQDDMACELLAAGASDFIAMPASLARLRHSLRMVLRIRHMADYMGWLERKLSGSMDFSDLIGRDPQMQRVIETARQAAASKIPIWIEGAPGTEMELLARAIHGDSGRASKPMVVVNCRMISADYAEAVLFGGAKGADHAMLGKLREAEGGTLLLEEVGDLPATAQSQLLGFLETGMVLPLGAETAMKLDVRIICASTRSVPHQPFDTRRAHPLTQRLRSVVLTLPPLAERRGDIALIAQYWLAHHSASEMKVVQSISADAMAWLSRQPWPGNVHQLSDVIWRAVCMASSAQLELADFAALLPPLASTPTPPNIVDAEGKIRTLRSIQEEAIRFALHHSGGCMTRAAKYLGIGRSTLYRKLEEHQISRANQTTRPMMMVSSASRSNIEY